MKKRGFLFVIVFTMVLSFSACKKTNSYVPSGALRINDNDIQVDYVMKIDDYLVSADEYRYFFMNLVKEFLATSVEFDSSSSKFLWTDEQKDLVKATTEEYVRINRAISVLSESFGLRLTEIDLQNIQDELQEFKSSYDSDEIYESVLAANYLTESYYIELLKSNYLQEKLSNYLTGVNGTLVISDEDMIQKIHEDYVCIRYLFLNKDEADSIANRSLAEELYSKVTDVDSLIKLINIYSDEPSVKNNVDGVYIDSRYKDSELYPIACTIPVGEISGIVETEKGYYIITRMGMDDEYLLSNIQKYKDDYYADLLQNQIKDTEEKMTVTYNEDIYDLISVDSMK